MARRNEKNRQKTKESSSDRKSEPSNIKKHDTMSMKFDSTNIFRSDSKCVFLLFFSFSLLCFSIVYFTFHRLRRLNSLRYYLMFGFQFSFGSLVFTHKHTRPTTGFKAKYIYDTRADFKHHVLGQRKCKHWTSHGSANLMLLLFSLVNTRLLSIFHCICMYWMQSVALYSNKAIKN